MKRVSPFRAGAVSVLASFAILLSSSALGLAQDIATKGGISGRVTDSAGAAIANAKITITGPTGDRTVTANAEGEFEMQNLIPGSYKVKVEQSGFKTLNVPGVEVYVGKTSALKLSLETGNISEVVEVTAGAATVDTTSTAIGSNLNDQLYQNIPLARSVQSLFYLAPGATDGLGGGQANPSISGGSALDNLYIADGVNITDSAFGGLGVFTRSYGSLGTAINTTYIKEVQVKTAGFEPQFGQAQGGIVNIITKSGTNQYHGEVFGFFQPKSFEAERLFVDDVVSNRAGKLLHPENYDAGFEFGGPAPRLKDRVFFFGSFNPTVRRDIVRGAEGSGLRTIYGDGTHRHTYTKNYAAKVDAILSSKHQFNFSIFGDPTTTNVAPFRTLNIDNTTANSRLDYGTRNLAVRYNGTISPTWTVSSSFSFGKNTFSESGFANFSQITDLTQLQDPDINPTGRGQFTPIGLGFFEPTQSRTYRGTVDTSKRASIWGEHTFSIGYQYQRAFYDGLRDRSGPKYTIPATNANGTLTIPSNVAGQPLNAQFRLRLAGASCTLCPLMVIPGNIDDVGFGTGVMPVFLQQIRGEFGKPVFDTQSNYHAAYAQDTWRLNRFITALIGYRWEQERVIGAILPESGKRNAYSFTGQWSPRLGVTVDPFGKGKTKLYYNFGRFHEFLPLDAAERSLSSEKDFTGGRYAPDFTVIGGNRRVVINRFGTVNPIIDASHLLSGAAGGTGGPPTISAQDVSNPIIPGTKLGYTNEHLIGFEQQLPGKWYFSVRYIDRRIGRIIEDAASVSPEAANGGIGQTYFIGNINKSLDASVNLVPFKFTPAITTVLVKGKPTDFVTNTPSGCASTPSGVPGIGLQPKYFFNGSTGVCFAQTGVDENDASIVRPDGKADGFPNPVRNYKAVEIELNKRFSSGWQVMSNWRIAKLVGNFEGHLRNDNGQTDPGISSLFDFTTGDLNLLGDQFAAGILNTDRRHIINLYGSYEFGEQYSKLRILKGLNAGTNIRFQSGIPISEYLAHPVYLNAGEIPVGGRGKLGRTPFYGQMDLHFDYRWSLTETWKLRYEVNFFNVTNNRDVRLVNQFRELQADVPNRDFRLPAAYYNPLRVQMGLKLSF